MNAFSRVRRWPPELFAALVPVRATRCRVCLPYTPLAVYETLISKQMESLAHLEAMRLAAASKAQPMPESLRRIFEVALSEHGRRAPTLWLQYAAYHLRASNFLAAAAVHARALRMLDAESRASFMEEYQQTASGA